MIGGMKEEKRGGKGKRVSDSEKDADNANVCSTNLLVTRSRWMKRSKCCGFAQTFMRVSPGKPSLSIPWTKMKIQLPLWMTMLRFQMLSQPRFHSSTLGTRNVYTPRPCLPPASPLELCTHMSFQSSYPWVGCTVNSRLFRIQPSK